MADSHLRDSRLYFWGAALFFGGKASFFLFLGFRLGGLFLWLRVFVGMGWRLWCFLSRLSLLSAGPIYIFFFFMGLTCGADIFFSFKGADVRGG